MKTALRVLRIKGSGDLGPTDPISSPTQTQEQVIDSYIQKQLLGIPNGDGSYKLPNGISVKPAVLQGMLVLADIANRKVYNQNGYMLTIDSNRKIIVSNQQGFSVSPLSKTSTDSLLDNSSSIGSSNGSSSTDTPSTQNTIARSDLNQPGQSQPSEEKKLPAWVIPTGVGVGALAIGATATYFIVKSKKRR